jgi:hypothetical protein
VRDTAPPNTPVAAKARAVGIAALPGGKKNPPIAKNTAKPTATAATLRTYRCPIVSSSHPILALSNARFSRERVEEKLPTVAAVGKALVGCNRC